MSIELHCTQCQKLIRAPDKAGGRRGKCPYCGNSVYIPTPAGEDEEIGLAPLDEEEENRAEEERRRATRYAAQVDHESGGVPASDDEPASGLDDSPGEVVDIDAEVESYVLAMRDAALDAAQAAAARLKRIGPRARDHVQGMLADSMLPAFENLPAPVAQGFLKKLLGELS